MRSLAEGVPTRSRRIAALAAAALVAAVPAATATPAVATSPGPRPVTSRLAVVPADQTSWVTVHWTTGRKICAARLTVTGTDVLIGYPGDAGMHTSFSRSDRLKPGRPDYTAFAVLPAGDDDRVLRLEATLNYHTCGRHPVEKSRIFRLTLPVIPAEGDYARPAGAAGRA